MFEYIILKKDRSDFLRLLSNIKNKKYTKKEFIEKSTITVFSKSDEALDFFNFQITKYGGKKNKFIIFPKNGFFDKLFAENFNSKKYSNLFTINHPITRKECILNVQLASFLSTPLKRSSGDSKIVREYLLQSIGDGKEIKTIFLDNHKLIYVPNIYDKFYEEDIYFYGRL